MFGQTTVARAYTATVRLWDNPQKIGAFETHYVDVVAYDLGEAMIQAGMKFKLEHAIDGDRYAVPYVCAKTEKREADVLAALFALPPVEKKTAQGDVGRPPKYKQV